MWDCYCQDTLHKRPSIPAARTYTHGIIQRGGTCSRRFECDYRPEADKYPRSIVVCAHVGNIKSH